MRVSATAYHRGFHVPEKALKPQPEECPICGFSGVRRAVYRIQQDPGIDLLECPNCFGRSADRIPEDWFLDEYYSSYYVDKDAETGLNTESDGEGTFYRPLRLAHYITKNIPELSGRDRFSVLDFGGGSGAVGLGVARGVLANGGARSVDLVVVEPADYTRPSGDPRITVSHVRDLAEIEGPFDVVIASAILEHIPNPGAVLRRFAELTVSGAVLYARTPAMLPFLRLTRAMDMTFPAHLHDLGDSFWSNAPRTLGIPFAIMRSTPSMIETGFAQKPARTLAAMILKTPAWVEQRLHDGPLLWNWYGGWQVLFRRS